MNPQIGFCTLSRTHKYGLVVRDSSVGTATHCGLDGPGIEFRWGARFFHPSRPAVGPTRCAIQAQADQAAAQGGRFEGEASKLSKLLIKQVFSFRFLSFINIRVYLRVKIISAMKHQHGQITISFSRVSHPRKPEQQVRRHKFNI